MILSLFIDIFQYLYLAFLSNGRKEACNKNNAQINQSIAKPRPKCSQSLSCWSQEPRLA